MLKNVLVGKLADAFSEYLEGLSPENVKADLGLNVGTLTLNNTRLKKDAPYWRAMRLELLDSRVNVRVNIPWKQLSTEPWVVDIADMELQLRMLAPGADSRDIQKDLLEKEKQIQKLEEKVAALRDGRSVSRVAQIAHAVMRQIMISATRLRAIIHNCHQGVASEMELKIESASLKSIASSTSDDFVQANSLFGQSAPSDEKILRKVFFLRGLTADFNRTSGSPGSTMLGPLPLAVQLRHDIQKGCLHVQAKSNVNNNSPLISMDKDLLKHLVGIAECFASSKAVDSSLPAGAGKCYAKLYYRKHIDGSLSREDENQLHSIERIATVAWIVGWRQWCQRMGASSAASLSSDADNLIEEWSDEDGNEVTVELGSLSHVSVELDLPRVSAQYNHTANNDTTHTVEQIIQLRADGTKFMMEARAKNMHGDACRIWNLKTCLQTTSMEALLDGNQLYALAKTEEPVGARDMEPFGGRGSTSPLLLGIDAQESRGSESTVSQWEVRLSCNVARSDLYLSPWCIHDLLTIALDISGAIKGDLDMVLPRHKNVITLSDMQEEIEALKISSVLSQVVLSLNVSAQAPVVHFTLPDDCLQFHMGVLHARSRLLTTNSAMIEKCDARSLEAELVPVKELACVCELRDTILDLSHHGKGKRSVYEPSSIVLTVNEQKIVLHARAFKVQLSARLFEALGQLKLGCEYIMKPLAELRQQRATRTTAHMERHASSSSDSPQSKLATVCITMEMCEASWNDFQEQRTIVATLQNLTADYVQNKDGSFDVKAELSHLEFGTSAKTLLNCPGACSWAEDATPSSRATLTLHHSKSCSLAELASPYIVVHWVGSEVRKALDILRRAKQHLVHGEELARRTVLIAVENLGRRAWNIYMDNMKKEILTKAAYFYGLSDEGIEISGACATVHAEKSNEVRRFKLSCTMPGLSVYVGTESDYMEQAHIRILGALIGLENDVRADLKANVSLADITCSLGSRTILVERNANERLLDIAAEAKLAPERHVSVSASWGQVAFVYHQRDVDSLAVLFRDEMFEVVKNTSVEDEEEILAGLCHDENTSGGDAAQICTLNGFSAEYRLEIGAPLVFLPTDLGRYEGRHNKGSQLEVVDARCRYKPALGDSYAVVDCGTFSVVGEFVRGKLGPVNVGMRSMQVFTAFPSNSDEEDWSSRTALETQSKLLNLVGIDAKVTIEESTISTTAALLQTELSAEDWTADWIPHASLTRRDVTQMLDIAFCNLNYARQATGALPTLGRSSSTSSSPTSTREKFKLSLQWEGPLCLDIAFSRDAALQSESMLTSIHLSNGGLDVLKDAMGLKTCIWCEGGRAKDCRREAKNVSKRLIDLPSVKGQKGLQIEIWMPPVGSAASQSVDIALKGAVFSVLPQLCMDLSIWALSSYQQSTQAKMLRAWSEEETTTMLEVEEPSNNNVIKVGVLVEALTVRLATRWDNTDEYFDLCGNLNVLVEAIGNDVKIEHVKVYDACLKRGSAGKHVGNLCQSFLQASANGTFQKTAYSEKGRGGMVRRSIRKNIVKLDLLEIQPLRMRFTVPDLKAISQALTTIMRYEADSSEPGIELNQRDPLAWNARQYLEVAACVGIGLVELQILDVSARPALSLEVACPLVSVSSETSIGRAPRACIKPMQPLQVGVRYYNERIGCWEPVLAPSFWVLIFEMEQEGAAEEIRTKLQMRPDHGSNEHVAVALTAPFVHLLARLAAIQASDKAICYGDMIVAFNLSGVRCSARQQQRKFDLEEDGSEIALDPSFPDIVLHFPDCRAQGKNEVTMSLVSESARTWKCEVSGQPVILLIRVMMPNPPQRVLLISSTVLISNGTCCDVEAQFTSLDTNRQIECGGVPAHIQRTFVQADPTLHYRNANRGSSSFLIPSGCLVAAPLCATLNVSVKMRLACGLYGWGDPHSPDKPSVSLSKSLAPDSDLPPYYLHLETKRTTSTWSELCIQAPVRLANACPCAIYVACWPNSICKELKVVTDCCHEDQIVFVADGINSTWEVSKDKEVVVYPLRLDETQSIHWTISGSKRKHAIPPMSNYVRIRRSGKEMVWSFCELQCAHPALQSEMELRLSPHKEDAIHSINPTKRFFSVALEDGDTNIRTAWSRPLPLIVTGDPSKEHRLKLEWQGGQVVLGAKWMKERQLVLFARHWFADATGLDLGLVQHSGESLPKFGGKISLFGDVISESPSLTLKRAFPGSRPVTAQMPILGSSSKVQLQSHGQSQQIVLQAEQIDATATFDVLCTLTTAVPSLMAFTRVKGFQIGFRQHGEQSVTWLGPGPPNDSSACLFFSETQESHRIQLAARPETCTLSTKEWLALGLDFSAPFTITESGIGAYPIVLETGSGLCWVCVQVDQTGDVFTITAGGESDCHQLINRHPCYHASASFGGDNIEKVTATHGRSTPIGKYTLDRSNEHVRNKLILELLPVDAFALAQDQPRPLRLDLERAQYHQVRHHNRVVAIVRVELRARKAHVVVQPATFSGVSDDWSMNVELKLSIPQLSITAFGESASSEPVPTFAVTLWDIILNCKQKAKSTRFTNFVLRKLQVDVLRNRRDVVLASVGDCFLRTSIEREDLAARNIKIRQAELDFGVDRDGRALELKVDDALLKVIETFMKGVTPRHFGLELDRVKNIVTNTYDKSLGRPPLPSIKYQLQNIRIGPVKGRVWFSARLSLLPDVVQVLLTFSSFSNSLNANGVNVKLEGHSQKEFEGSLRALSSLMLQTYKPMLGNSWTSLVNNSNALLGGVLTRHFWDPKERTVTRAQSSRWVVKDGCVMAPSDSASQRLSVGSFALEGVGSFAPLDSDGYASVMKDGSTEEIQMFIMRLLDSMDCKVRDHSALREFASHYSRRNVQQTFDDLLNILTDSDAPPDWVQYP